MMKIISLSLALVALVSAQTSTDAPVLADQQVISTFEGDLATTSAEDQATLISEVNVYMRDFFGAAEVSTTLASGSIVATSIVSGPTIEPYTAPVGVSAMFGSATGTIVNAVDVGSPGQGSGDRTGGYGAEGGMMGKGGMGMGGEGGEAGGMGKGKGGGGKGGGGKGGGGKGSGAGKGQGAEAGEGGKAGKGMGGSGKGAEAGEAGNKGAGGSGKGYGNESGSMHDSASRTSVSGDTIATLSAGIVLVAGVSLLAVRRHRQHKTYGEYELQLDQEDIEVVIPSEDTPLVV